MGGDITYKYLGNNGPTDRPFRFSVRFVAYIDRFGGNWSCGNLGTDVLLGVFDAGTSQVIPRIPGAVSPTTVFWPLPSHGVSQGPCPDPFIYPAIRPLVIPGSVACYDPISAPLSVAITDTTFEIQLPLSASGYYIKFETCCRIFNTSNLNLNSSDVGNTWLAFIPSPIRLNSSPQFTQDALPLICQGDTTIFSNTATDADGDRLQFSLATPYSGGSGNPSAIFVNPVNAPYKTGFSAQQPFGAFGYASINPATGLTKLYSSIQGAFAIAFDVAEYRTLPGGTEILISTTRREQLFIVKGYTNPSTIYKPLPDAGANWNMAREKFCTAPGGRWFYSIRYNGDTLVGNKTFKKLDIPFYHADPASTFQCLVTSQPGLYAGALRQDNTNRKVYFLPPNNTQELLLYDFTMTVGDTLKGYLASSLTYKVVSINTFVGGGLVRKQLNLVMSGCPSDTLRFIEGIGSSYGLLYGPTPCIADVDRNSLLCMSVGNIPQYQLPNISNCALITTNKTIISAPTFSLYPNPAEEYFQIESKSPILSASIIDGTGREIEIQLPGDGKFPLRGLGGRLYWVKIQTKDGVAVQKMVKK